MIAVLILMILLSLFCIIMSCVSVYVAYKALVGFLSIQEQHEEYKRYLKVILDDIEEHSAIFRTSLAQKVGMVQEWHELNKLLQNLETRMNSFKYTLREFLSVEN